MSMGQCAEGEGNRNLFLEFYSFASKILILVKMFLRRFRKMDMADEDESEDGEKEDEKIYAAITSWEDFPFLWGACVCACVKESENIC